jgi:hypothetical protein
MRRVRWRSEAVGRSHEAVGRSQVTGWLAVACVAMIAVLNSKPEFSNASLAPRGIPSPVVALEVGRSVTEVDSILGEAPSPDRETMRIKQYIDFGFIACYVSLYAVLATFFRSSVAIAAAACGVAAGVLDVFENIAILRILDVPLRDTTQAMVDAIRHPSLAKWALAFLANGLFGYVFLQSSRFQENKPWLSRAIGTANLMAAALGIYGLFDNAFLVWAGVPMLAGLAGIIARFLLFA